MSVSPDIVGAFEHYVSPRAITIPRRLGVTWARGAAPEGKLYYRHATRFAPTASFDLPAGEAAQIDEMLLLAILVQEYAQLAGTAESATENEEPEYRVESPHVPSRQMLSRIGQVSAANHDLLAEYSDDELGLSW
jgi:hypothetical protein